MEKHDLKQTCDIFYNRIYELEFEISEYEQIYKSSNSIISKYYFFGRLNRMYWLNFIFKIYALCDKDKYNKNDNNLSLDYIISNLESAETTPFEEIKYLKEEIDEILIPWKKFRNKIIGHYDLNWIIEDSLKIPLSLENLRLVIEKIFAILNIISDVLKHQPKIRTVPQSEVKKVLSLIESGFIANEKNG